MKVVLSGSFLEPGYKTELLKGGALDFIQKPSIPTDVVKKIREILDRG